MQDKPKFDRAVEDLGNILSLKHVNTRVPDQHIATIFYVMGLGLTRDPYLMTGIGNMWINVGKSQFHLPTGEPQVLRGHTGLVIPDRRSLIQRLESVREPLRGTKFAFRVGDGVVDATCPWGNRIRCFEPAPRFGRRMQLGMPYVEFEVARGTADGIVRFYQQIMASPATVGQDAEGPFARVTVGPDQNLIFRECDAKHPEFDGHHIAVYIADFSGPYRKLLAKTLVSREDDQHQYRFLDIVDPQSGTPLFTIEHEVRSMHHPLYGRPFVNRNPAQSNQRFAPGWEQQSWAAPLDG